MEPTASPKTRRIEVRLSDEERQLDAAAASALGESLSDFFRRAAQARAQEVLADQRTIALSEVEAARFLEALDRDVERRGLPVTVLLTVPWHERSITELVERYAAGDGAPAGVEPAQGSTPAAAAGRAGSAGRTRRVRRVRRFRRSQTVGR